MDNTDLDELVRVFETALQSTDETQRREAEKLILNLREGTDAFQKFEYLLCRTQSPFVISVAVATLAKIANDQNSPVNTSQKSELRTFLLNRLYAVDDLPPYTVTAICQAIAKMTKGCWFETVDSVLVFQETLKDAQKFLQGGMDRRCVVGVMLYNSIVQEMSTEDAGMSLAKHRRLSASLRDTFLLDVFTCAVSMLSDMTSKSLDLNNQIQNELVSSLLVLINTCLQYDFFGVGVDDSVDEFVLQIPVSWKPFFVELRIVRLLFSCFELFPVSLCAGVLECAVQVVSVRRSLFMEAERMVFLNAVWQGVKLVLASPHKLMARDCYHQFCRLVGRLKAKYQTSELVKVDAYSEVMTGLVELTVTSLHSLDCEANSLYFLLFFWDKCAMSMVSLKGENHQMEQFLPRITKALVESKLELFAYVLQGTVENPFDDQASLEQQLEQFMYICRCQYQDTCMLLMGHFTRLSTLVLQGINSESYMQSSERTLHEYQTAWMIYLIAHAVSGHNTYGIADDDEDIWDGQLTCTVLQFVSEVDSHLPVRRFELVELAALVFVEKFKKVYLYDQLNKQTKAMQVLADKLGLNDEMVILDVLAQKVILNLKQWGSSGPVLSATLEFMSELCAAYRLPRQFVKLDCMQYLLFRQNEELPFLSTTSEMPVKQRYLYYRSVGALLASESEEGERFDEFSKHLSLKLDRLAELLRIDPHGDATKFLLVGLAYDIRGLSSAFSTTALYSVLFEWLYPRYLKLFEAGMSFWRQDISVATPLLQVFSELSLNRSQRLCFDVMSPNGTLLFREVAQVLCCYSEHLSSLKLISPDSVYTAKIKGIIHCFRLLKAVLAGGYVNFGVLSLYGDPALSNVLETFVKLLLLTTDEERSSYPKLSEAYYNLVDTITKHHMNFLTQMNSNVFYYFLSTVTAGVGVSNTSVSTESCSALDNLLSFLYKKCVRSRQQGAAAVASEVVNLLGDSVRDLLHRTMVDMIHLIIYEDCQNLWSLSRPLFVLILMDIPYFNDLQLQLLSVVPLEKSSELQSILSQLMEDIDPDLSTKSRDAFNKKLSSFKVKVKNLLASPVVTESYF